MSEQSVDKQDAQNFGEHIASSRDASKIKCLWTGNSRGKRDKVSDAHVRISGEKTTNKQKTKQKVRCSIHFKKKTVKSGKS